MRRQLHRGLHDEVCRAAEAGVQDRPLGVAVDGGGEEEEREEQEQGVEAGLEREGRRQITHAQIQIRREFSGGEGL